MLTTIHTRIKRKLIDDMCWYYRRMLYFAIMMIAALSVATIGVALFIMLLDVLRNAI